VCYGLRVLELVREGVVDEGDSGAIEEEEARVVAACSWVMHSGATQANHGIELGGVPTLRGFGAAILGV